MNQEYVLARKILKLANRIVSNRNIHLKELGLTAEQADCLNFLIPSTDKTISDLKEYLNVTHQTACGIAKRLEKQGLIQMQVDSEDARYRRISLTEQGKKMCEALKKNGTHTGQQLLTGMNADERRYFCDLLEKALNNVEKK